MSRNRYTDGDFGRLNLATLLALAVSLLGLALRIEHALTFDGPLRGADYAVNLHGVRWMIEHHRPFNFTEEVSGQVRYQPPLWYGLGAVILHFTGYERPIAALAVLGWVLRQLLLARMLTRAIPRHAWSALVALSINALLPISVLTDGKLNPEGLHSSLFMLAIYGLWCIEREAHSEGGVSFRTGLWFGAACGLAVLTKATAGVLPMAAAAVFVWQWWCLRDRADAQIARTKLVRAGASAALAWLLVAGWWCGPNFVKYGHPFPHSWNLAPQSEVPVLYRRPLGWALPFEWKEYLRSPIIHDDQDPRPNFWAVCVTGTWTDFYNRGFCRLRGGEMTNRAWGASWAPPNGGPLWAVSLRCVELFRKLLYSGFAITLAGLIALAHMLRSHLRTSGSQGSLALPIASALVVFFVMLFALVFPFDDNAVLNPRYLLPIATPMAACLAISLAHAPLPKRARQFAHALLLLAIASVGTLVVFERFGS